MKVVVISVGKPGTLLAGPIAEYEARIAHYWKMEVIEVAAGAGKGRPAAEEVRSAEADRILGRIPEGTEVMALSRDGRGITSTGLARHLSSLALASSPGITFILGGAFGLAVRVLERADRVLSLSPMTLPHEIARLVLAEQLYRAGTILRNEPYHKGTS